MRPLALLSLIALAGAAVAAPRPQPEVSAGAKALPTVADALALLHKAYREGPTTDRVVIKATNADGRDKRVQAVVYTDRGLVPKAGEPATKARPAQARVDLVQLQIHVKDKVLTALNVFDRTTYFRAEGAEDIPGALSAHFPPIPLPQLQLAFADETTLAAPTPLTAGCSWSAVEAATEFGRPMLILKGQAAKGPVAITFDRQSGRLRKLTAEFPGAAGPALSRLELTSSPGDSGDAKNWVLPVDGRTRVDSPAMLVPPRSGLGAGSSIKHASLMTAALAPVAPETLFGKAGDPVAPKAAILVVFRTEALAGGFSEHDLAAALAAAGAAAADAKNGPFVVRAVGILGKNEMDPDKIEAAAARAAGVLAKAGLPGAGATPLLTASEVLTVERGGQAVDVAAVALGADLKVRGVVVADHRAGEPAKLSEELAAACTAEPKKPDAKPDGKPDAKPDAKPETKPDEPKGPSGAK